MRIRSTAAIALALGATAALAGSTAASAQDAGDQGTGPGPKVEFVCENQALIQEAIDAGQAAADSRLELLGAARAAAEAEGRAHVVARIDRRIDRVGQHVERLAAREARLAEVVSEHCTAA
jgi:hypothetical protein